MSDKVDVSVAVCVRCGRTSMDGFVCSACQGHEKSYTAHKALVESGQIQERICPGCGKPIPIERLEAVPDCTRCIKCQTVYEEKHYEDQLAGVMVYDGKTGGSIMLTSVGEHKKWKDRWR